MMTITKGSFPQMVWLLSSLIYPDDWRSNRPDKRIFMCVNAKSRERERERRKRSKFPRTKISQYRKEKTTGCTDRGERMQNPLRYSAEMVGDLEWISTLYFHRVALSRMLILPSTYRGLDRTFDERKNTFKSISSCEPKFVKENSKWAIAVIW